LWLCLGSGVGLASSRYSCAEISNPKFLKAFNIEKNGDPLFRALFEDQVAALKFKEGCIAKRWEVLDALYRELPAEPLKKAELQILVGRMRLMQGSGDLGDEHFSLALKFSPKNSQALYYAAEGARKKGDREKERALLENLAFSDFEKHPAQKELFDAAFDRLSYLVTASKAEELIEGAWKRLDRTSRLRAKRGLEIGDYFRDPKKMERYFTDAFGSGELNYAPPWAHYMRARYYLHKQDMPSALESFDRSISGRKEFSEKDYRDTESWLELASANSSFKYLRKWCEFALKQSWSKTLEVNTRNKLERYYVQALEGGAIDAKAPVRDLERAQKILPGAPEIMLLSVEVLLRQRAPLLPEGGYRSQKLAFEKARLLLRYLQNQDVVAIDASYWELWMDWGLGKLQQVRGRSDIVFSELQRGKVFRREALLENFWEICRRLYTRTRGLRDYRAKLRLISNDSQVAESVRQSAEKELKTLPQ
jgi:hypothetical protein